MKRVTTRHRILKFADGCSFSCGEDVVTEEPLEIRVRGRAPATIMRTPGDDIDLAVGFLVSQGVVSRLEHVRSMRYSAGATPDGGNSDNSLDVVLGDDARLRDCTWEPNLNPTLSSRLPGRTSSEAVLIRAVWDVAADRTALDPELVAILPDRLRSAQRLFDRTGGMHVAGLFSLTGELLCIREDIGRHKAVDKLVGWALREDRLPLRQTVLLVLGRASFDLVQKAVMAGIPALATVSAPTSRAIELAEATGLTLVGHLRGASMNVYAGVHRWRLRSPARDATAARVGPESPPHVVRAEKWSAQRTAG